MVALTFDDGPDARWTPLVLDALDAASTPATFFVVAEQIAAPGGAELLAETVRRGHSVQPHCARHLYHESLSLQELRADAIAIERALADHGVGAPALWRPPYGSVHPQHSHAAAAEHGWQLVRWSHDTVDYRGVSAEDMLAGAVAGLGADSVVLMHDSRRYTSTPQGGAQNTVELIAPLTAHVRARGWELGALREPLRDGDAFLLPRG